MRHLLSLVFGFLAQRARAVRSRRAFAGVVAAAILGALALLIETVLNTHAACFGIAAEQETVLHGQGGSDVKIASISTGASGPNSIFVRPRVNGKESVSCV